MAQFLGGTVIRDNQRLGGLITPDRNLLIDLVAPQSEEIMNSVIVVTRRPYDDEIRRLLEQCGGLALEEGQDFLIVRRATSRVYIARNDGVLGELEPAELSEITAMIPQPFFYSVDYSDVDLCRLIVAAIADDDDVLVDNDHGVRLRGSEFVSMMKRRPEWDWRLNLER